MSCMLFVSKDFLRLLFRFINKLNINFRNKTILFEWTIVTNVYGNRLIFTWSNCEIT